MTYVFHLTGPRISPDVAVSITSGPISSLCGWNDTLGCRILQEYLNTAPTTYVTLVREVALPCWWSVETLLRECFRFLPQAEYQPRFENRLADASRHYPMSRVRLLDA